MACTVLACLLGNGTPLSAGDPRVAADFVLRNALVIDGTGAPGKHVDVAIRNDRIAAIGVVAAEPGAREIDASGLIVAPGFIDLHTHSDDVILDPKTRANLNYISQGVTTIVTGNCGSGAIDIAKYFGAIDKHGAATNVIHLIPHGKLRGRILGNSPRAPDSAELERMRAVVDAQMKAGAWGMSTGLIYLPGRYAETAELIALARIVARHGGFYASHIRNEGSGLLDAIDEALQIGREARLPVHISHLKASGRSNWGLAEPACRRIEEARSAGQAVTADQYPYVASSTQLAAMVIPDWALRGGTEEFSRIAADPVRGAALRREIHADLDAHEHGASIRIARYSPRPDRVGLDLAAIARREGITPLQVVLDVQSHGGATAIHFGMSENDVRSIMAEPFVATASDGSAHQPGGNDRPHPRAYGTFPRKIRYALDEKVITLEAAIRSCTGLPAEILQLPDRGLIRVGAFADLVVFDPRTFRDAATFEHPTRYASGVSYLFVNGVPVIAQAKPTKAAPGRALRRQADGPPDLILEAKKIWTGDRGQPWAEAAAMRAGEIIAVGSAEEMRRLPQAGARHLTLPSAFVLPGLIDAHGHLIDLGLSQEEIELRGADSPQAVARSVRSWIDAHPGDGWVTGQNWDQSLWPGGEFPSASMLDTVAPNRPVWLLRVDGHAGWANSEALRRSKVTRDSVSPSDGQILRDPQGNPTGVFIDGAKSLVSRSVPQPGRADFTRQILAGQALVLKDGLTGVHEAGVPPLAVEAYRELDRAGKLKVRLYGMASVPPEQELAFLSHPPIPRKGHSRFELRAIKIFMDGAMGSRGGLLFEPYSDDPGNAGLLLCEPERLEAITTAALKHGWQVATHAIGDRANALVLDAYEAALRKVPESRDARLRVEHAQVVRKEDVPRFVKAGLVASMQPSHAIDDMRWADARLGPARVKGAYAWRWFLDEKVTLAFGSDFPVEIANPFLGLYAAITREDPKGKPPGGWHPDQKMSLDEALRAFTAGAAFASFDEHRLGVIQPGFRADFTVVDRNPFEVSPRELLDTKVLMTVVDGEVVYKAKD